MTFWQFKMHPLVKWIVNKLNDAAQSTLAEREAMYIGLAAVAPPALLRGQSPPLTGSRTRWARVPARVSILNRYRRR